MSQGAPGRLVRELQPILSRLAMQATSKWQMHLLTESPCYGCNRPSLGPCVKCSEPTCLHHAWMSVDADLLCHACAGGKAARKKSKPPPAAPDPEAARVAALRELGLGPDASWHEVQVRFREIVAKNHPDRFPPARREKAQERFKRITAAYEVLKQRSAA